MRSKLLTSLLIGLIPAVSIALEPAKVKLNGRLDTMAGYVKEGRGYRNTNPTQPDTSDKFHNGAIVNDTNIDIHIDGKTTKDFSYGGFIRLHADVSNATNGETTFGDKTMLYVQHEKIGRLEGGNTPGAGGLFEMDVPFFDVGTWGIDGFWSQWVGQRTKKYYSTIFPLAQFFPSLDLNANSRGFEFITGPNLLSNYSGNFYSDAPKINFFTKPVTGLTLGVAYIPDMDSHGTISGVAFKNSGPTDSGRKNYPATFKEIISGGGTYETKFNTDYTIKVGLVGEIGKAKSPIVRDLKAMEADLALSYKQFKVTASYGNWWRSLMLKTPSPNSKHKAEYWTVGFGQQLDKLSYAFTFMHSKKAGGLEALASEHPNINTAILSDYGTNKFNLGCIDIDYKLAQGFSPYIGVAIFQFKEASGKVATGLTTTQDVPRHTDTGYVIMAGTRLMF